MSTTAAVGFAVFVWWFGTALVLALNTRDRGTYPKALAGAAVVTAVALEAVFRSRGHATPAGALVGFVGAITVWGCQEMAFYMGAITGPNRAAHDPSITGFARARAATRAVLHHELALAAGMVAIAALCWGAENQTATGVYAVLWVMRLSAKLNVFLGVRNLHEEFVPGPLRYLVTYMRRAPMNPLFPVSVGVSTAVLVALIQRARVAEAGAATGLVLVATLLALAILEHGFMVLPLPSARLWRWAMRSRGPLAP